MTANFLTLHKLRTAESDTASCSQTDSPAKGSRPETPLAAVNLSNGDRSLLVRVLNRNLLQQREESNLHSLHSDPLLTSLPAGESLTRSDQLSKPIWKDGHASCVSIEQCLCQPNNVRRAGSPLSYPNSATARMLPDQTWAALHTHATSTPDSPDDRSPVTPAALLLSSCDSPTTVLLQAAGNTLSGTCIKSLVQSRSHSCTAVLSHFLAWQRAASHDNGSYEEDRSIEQYLCMSLEHAMLLYSLMSPT